MKNLAKYSMTATSDSVTAAKASFEDAVECVEEWLKSKGARNEDRTGFWIEMNGKRADLNYDGFDREFGSMTSWVLKEPIQIGNFRTEISLAQMDDVLVFGCVLSAVSSSTLIAPQRVPARCPRVIRDLMDRKIPWSISGTDPRYSPILYTGKEGGDAFAAMVKDSHRNLPIVAVSQLDGFHMEPNLPKKLAADLSGLALVGDLDQNCSWRLTEKLGKEWSCFHGAIRVYWPTSAIPQHWGHPRWLDRDSRTREMSRTERVRKISNQVRNLIFDVSVLTVDRPKTFSTLEQRHRREERNERRERARSNFNNQYLAEESKELSEIALEDISKLEQRCEDLEREIDHLESLNLELHGTIEEQDESLRRFRYSESTGGLHKSVIDTDEVAPEAVDPPGTIFDAVGRAREELGQFLQFGPQVEEGVSRLAQEAGPPYKIFSYLEVFAEYSKLMQNGSTTGMVLPRWFRERNCNVGSESNSIANNPREKQKRTWDDGSGARYFDLHMKPTDGTHPDKCVRIYFAWDDISQKVIVGWVGRHP